MNKDRILYIAEWLENGAIHVDQMGRIWGFEMEEWAGTVDPDGYDEPNPEFPEECGSAMCIGGAAEQFFGLKEDGNWDNTKPAYELLDLDEGLAYTLFYPWEQKWYKDAGSPPMTPKYMAGVLRRLVETGELIG